MSSSGIQSGTSVSAAKNPDRSSTADPHADIVALARAATSRPRLMRASLNSIARYFHSPYAALHVRYTSEVLQEDCHFGSGDPAFWKDSLQSFLTDALTESRPLARLLKAKKGKTKVAFLASPVLDSSGSVIGGMAMVVYPIEEQNLATALTKLDSLVRLASFSAEYVGMSATEPGTTVSRGSAKAQAHAARCETTEELAFTITNELRNKLGCEQVALGLVRRRHVRVISISGLDDVRRQSPGVVSLTAAMEECLDAGVSITYQRNGGWAGEGVSKAFRLHKQWHAMAKGDAVASIPLRSNDKLTAILSLRQNADHPLTPEHVEEVRTRVEPFAAAFPLTEQANRSLLRHGRDVVHDGLSMLMEAGRWGRKVIAVAVLGFCAWFAFGTVSYDLAVDAVVTAAKTQHVVAPFDGVIIEAPLIEGDRVRSGQMLCRMDTRDLDQRRAQLLAELQVWERTMDKARADDRPFEVQIAKAKQTLSRTKLAIIDRRIEATTQVAPFDGVIVVGDLRKQIGGVVTRGQPLFEIAPLDLWTLELQVPDAASADLTTDLAGVFAGYARPDRTRSFRISRILASAQLRNNGNVFVAEADIAANDPWMRPGMEGLARVHVGRRPVWWAALHRVVDYIRISFWL